MRLIDFFDRGVAHFPHHPCLVDPVSGRSSTFLEVQELTHRIGHRLVAADVTAGASAAVLSHNHPDAFACILGIARSGAAWMPINARNGAADNIRILTDNECRWLFFHSEFAGVAAEICAAVPSLAGMVCIDAAAGAPHLATWSEEAPEGPCDVAAKPGDIAALWPSGGTTGRSKGVMLTHLNFETMIANFAACMSYGATPPVHLVAAPMTHAAGCIAFPLLAMGATQVVLPAADALAIMEAIERHRVTTLFLPPTVIYAMLAHPRVRDFDYSSLRHLIYAAAPMSSAKLVEAIDVFGPVLAQTFGQAEAPMLCTFLSPEEHLVGGRPAGEERLSSCGRSTPFTRLAIMDEAGDLLPPSVVGEIVVRGNLVMKGYYKDPQATEEAGRFGWHHTGDLGYRDVDGYFHIVDRKRDMIISGGFNIYPLEIEQVLWTHPAVEECAVIGVPDAKWGEAIKAIIQLKAGAVASAAELETLCRVRLGGMKTPKSFELWETLPRSPVGKVLKREIRERFWSGQARNV